MKRQLLEIVGRLFAPEIKVTDPVIDRKCPPWLERSCLGLRAASILAILGAGAIAAFGQSAEPLKTIVPVHIDVTTGNITVGSQSYSGKSAGMHLLALKRQPNRSHLNAPDVIQDGTFTDSASANQFLQNVLSATPDALLILNAVGNYGFPLSDLAANLAKFGSTDLTGIITIPNVLIGNGGRKAGQAWQRGVSVLNPDVDGYLAQDTNGNYKFIQTDYIRYDIGVDGSVTVGTKTYNVANAASKSEGCDASASNSFHLVIVDRQSPDTLISDKAYCTGPNPDQLKVLADDLGGVKDEGNLIFIASNGKPIPADWNFGTSGDKRVSALAEQMAALGGFFETILYLTPNDSYSFVGALAPPAGTPGARNRAREASSVYPDNPSGELHGILARGNRGNWYSPINADLSGSSNLQLYQILAQTPAAFPYPATNDELTAFQSISQKLCGSPSCNVRDQYNDANVDINTYQTTLEGMTNDPGGNNCTVAPNGNLPFCIVRQQLLTEFAYVSQIQKLYGNLQTLWLGSGTTGILSLLSAVDTVKANMGYAPPSAAQTPSLGGPIVNFFLSLLSAVPDVGPLFGIADAAMNFGSSLTTDSNGNQTSSISIPVGQLEQQAITHFTSQAIGIGTQFSLIYQDWGKIQALGVALTQAQPGSQWYWSPSATGEMLAAMQPVVEKAAYWSVMPTVYAIGSYNPDCAATTLGCTPVYIQPQSYLPYLRPFEPALQYIPFTYPADSTNIYQDPTNASYGATATMLADGGWLAISQQTNTNGGTSYQPPGTPVSTHLFTPISKGGLGVYRPAFFEAWPFPRVTCGKSQDEEGCDFSAAAPAAEARPDPVTSIAIRAGKVSRTGSTLNVPLRIVNNGTVVANAVEICTINLRALGGWGQANLVSPGLPIQIGTLAPTGRADILLRVAIPPGVSRLMISEDGSVDSGLPQKSRFSQGQVIFPDK